MTRKIQTLDVVDEKGKNISFASRKEIYSKKLRHKIVHVLVFDESGKLACQVRSSKMGFCPGCYSTSVGGHVEGGELPEDAAKREMKEEIGKSGELKFIFSDWFEINGLKKLLFVYKSKVFPPFKLNKREVDRIEYLTYDEIRQIKDDKIHPELKFIVNRLIAK